MCRSGQHKRPCLHVLYFPILCSVVQYNHFLWKSLNTSLSCIDCVCTDSRHRDNCCLTDCTLCSLRFALFLCKPLHTVKGSHTSETILKNREGPKRQSNTLECLLFSCCRLFGFPNQKVNNYFSWT